ncbi:MAG: hydrogenase formation protein HypD [candidate division Zixibacteria bacterium]|nr:hydrogenase formation protein HypD [candidate division Zixibacteria bacterium]
MKHLEEYRNPDAVKHYVRRIMETAGRRFTIMEICGGQTHAILKYGIDRLLEDNIGFIHGPGCPVCITPADKIIAAMEIASSDDVIFCSFGDMLRVPAGGGDLLSTRASGADVRMVYSPIDALKIARANPEKTVVFFAIGFETTAPATALAVYKAKMENLSNFSMLVSHSLVLPAVRYILSSPDNGIDGILAAGHVCTVSGYEGYEEIAREFEMPITVTGFEPVDLLRGIYSCVRLMESGKNIVDNQYSRAVVREGNKTARDMIGEVFRVADSEWRGIGIIRESGLVLREEYADYDALKRFGVSAPAVSESNECISGEVLKGNRKPYHCPAFGTKCTPEHPLGATMVSSEGACAAYYNYMEVRDRE